MTATKIEWTDRVWNPVTGCTKVSPGCDNCYAENIARRFAGGVAFPNGFDVTLRPTKLSEPLRWRKPARVFVNSMSDLFHEQVPDEFIAGVFATMAAAPRHTFQVLTKRHGRMRALLGSHRFWLLVVNRANLAKVSVPTANAHYLPNVWLGVSVEDQKRADLRVPALLDTPAAVRFLSCEPLIGPVTLNPGGYCWCGSGLDGIQCHLRAPDWVIVGGESGPGARPMKLEWAADLVAQCRRVGIPVFVKQLGSAQGPHKGGDLDTWPAELQVREFPQAVAA
jgi:protein gp37